MGLGVVMLSEVSQTEKDTYHLIPLKCRILKNSTNELIYKTNRVKDLGNKLIVTDGGGGRDKLGYWDCHVHTTIYKLDNQHRPTA